MPSGYPGALDAFATNLADGTATPTTHPTHHNDVADAVNKIEAELGITPSGIFATVVERLNGIKVVYKAATEANSTQTLQNDDELLFAIAANETWVVVFFLLTDGATDGDLKLALAVPAGAAGFQTVFGPGTAATTFENATANNQGEVGFGTGFPAGTLGVGNETLVIVVGAVDNAGNAGNVTLQWARNAAGSAESRVFAGSFLLAYRVA